MSLSPSDFLFAILMASAGSLGTSAREGQQLAGIFSGITALPFMVSIVLASTLLVCLIQLYASLGVTKLADQDES